ncbi:MAG: 30S ribosomal protein S12 methylthiotransferase RimO [Candidatus Aureabacteria bacterium]|nr:30S ribosomal protein S12 methylthiotransferase RimO [Candidatus Auribacterota bacterium]
MTIKVGVTSLGCAKNLVDSEVMLGYLKDGGLHVCEEIGEAQVIIVNTCSFIAEAEKEAGDTIRQLLEYKERGAIDRVVVAGCMFARRGESLAKRFPGVDRFIHPGEIPYMAGIVRDLMNGGDRKGASPAKGRREEGFLYDHLSPRVRLTPPHYAYIKVSEGCSNHCSYCLIPGIKGPLRSRQCESVVAEARALIENGVKEINLISQDTTAYGTDICGKSRLGDLMEKVAGMGKPAWIRLLYGHPAHYTDELLSLIAREEKVCKYVDFPLQHVSDRLLVSMNRRTTKKQLGEILHRIREIIPGVTVRTTFIVGYPGEKERDFQELLDFVGEARFEHMGAFIYSRENGTAAARFSGQVPHTVKRERFHRLMALQQQIVHEMNARMVGRVMKVLVDEELEEGQFTLRGRTEGDAPEVDGTVYVSGCNAKAGDFINVRITGAREYELAGVAVNDKIQKSKLNSTLSGKR